VMNSAAVRSTSSTCAAKATPGNSERGAARAVTDRPDVPLGRASTTTINGANAVGRRRRRDHQ
jgi:hypothetical protein